VSLAGYLPLPGDKEFLHARRYFNYELIDIVVKRFYKKMKKEHRDKVIPPAFSGTRPHPRAKSIEFFINIEDTVSQYDPDKMNCYSFGSPVYSPVLGAVGCSHSSSNIAIPQMCYEDRSIRRWPSVISNIKYYRDMFPWNERKEKAVFRGGLRTCLHNATETGECISPLAYKNEADVVEEFQHPNGTIELVHYTRLCGRVALHDFGKQHQDLLDVEIYGKNIPMPLQEQFKYIVYAEGHSGWANRLRRQAFMGTLVLKQLSSCQEWYAYDMKPYVHYVSVDYYFLNVTTAVEWSRANDDKAKHIVSNMNRYADNYLHVEHMEEYMYHILEMFYELTNYEVVRDPNTIPIQQALSENAKYGN